MIGITPPGEAVQKLAGTARKPVTRSKRPYCLRAPVENLEIRRDLAIAYLRLRQDWSIADLASVFHISRYQVMRAVSCVKEFDRQEKARRA